MLIIGKKINVLAPDVYDRLVSGDLSRIVSLAILQAESGADMLDINIGPDIADGERLMRDIVEAVQQSVDLPVVG